MEPEGAESSARQDKSPDNASHINKLMEMRGDETDHLGLRGTRGAECGGAPHSKDDGWLED